ncbi:MAG: Hpt domain-containing protein [Kiritimatiellae bacterium]|nr:Hpt domain-containing protein [Kiritimatiellia bacterium]
MKSCCREYLEKQFPGDDGVVEEIYGEYCSAMREKLSEMSQSLAQSDWEGLDRLAHTVKGNSLWVGDTEMAEVAIELRGAAKSSDAAKAEACIARLREIAAGL